MDFSILKGHPAIVLAPMEGVTDAPMRELITELTPVTHCVTEFLRISENQLPRKIYVQHVPELENESRTPAGRPVQLQLLGGDPEALTQAALNGVRWGARSIDINFGCPSPTVNRHDGGATLLKYPERMFSIISTLRQSLPKEIPVSAKIRLGFDTPQAVYKNAEMVFKAGADWLTIHARTRTQGYQPPVFWEFIRDINKDAPVPVIANGDIWSLDDFKRCRDLTKCDHFMLGRGILANPYLPIAIASELGLPVTSQMMFPTPEEWREIFMRMIGISEKHRHPPIKTLRRIKQWLALRQKRIASDSFNTIKRFEKLEDFMAASSDIKTFEFTRI